MRKILTVVGTRPELIKMSLVIAKLDRLCHHVLVHTGQNFDFELSQIFLDDLEIREPDYFLGVAAGNRAETIGRIIIEADRVFQREAPDAVLIYGDTNSGLSVIPAKHRKIPIFHMEAGNRCFDQRVPEELNRRLIDHLSDVNMVLTEHARRYLLAEGLSGERIFKTGSHLPEVLNHFRSKIQSSRILESLCLQQDRFFLVSAHREENVDSRERLAQLLKSLNAIVDHYQFPIVVSTHPRTRQRMSDLPYEPSPLVRFLPPFGFTDYIRLQSSAYCVISDSGTITEEASLLDFPAVMIREAHERPEGMDAGTLVMCSMHAEDLLCAITVVRDGIADQRFAGSVPDYNGGEVASKVVRIVMSYIDVVNRVVWSKPPGAASPTGTDREVSVHEKRRTHSPSTSSHDGGPQERQS
ncbi:MAG: hypothetical protein K0R61_659 [Microvirga sp.]|nr:hypothetical protein [Microvirga sp.]